MTPKTKTQNFMVSLPRRLSGRVEPSKLSLRLHCVALSVTKIKLQNLSIFKSFKLLIFIFFILQFAFFTFRCEKPTPPPDKPPYIPPIVLTSEDVSCTDAFISIKTTKVFESGTLQLKRDGITQSEIYNLQSQIDTLIVDEGLLPKRTYTYKAYRLTNNTIIDSSAELPITTMDTTSHNFSWDITYLGDGNSSVLRDVFILNDTLAYAVGEIYKKDSLGQWETEMYNMAKWNGKEWKLTKAYFEYQGQPYVTQLYAVYAFNENDIWVASTHPANWKGTKWIQYSLGSSFPGYPTKFWGTSSSNLYMVGTNGSIAYFNGVAWRRLELPPLAGQGGTDVSINDIWGAVDERTGKRLILCAASNVYEPGERKILRITEQNTVDTIPWVYYRRIHSIWFKNESRIFTSGSGVWMRRPDREWFEFKHLPPYFTDRVRGTSINDIFVVGNFGLFLHFNGFNWKFFSNVNAADIYYSVDYKKNTMVAVGRGGSKSIILRMWR
ncbi:MAG: hypothetical protein Q8K98_07125 [Bacteroidota bacterium]|nr:hypothetical protein [Bacteroidota bacterium]